MTQRRFPVVLLCLTLVLALLVTGFGAPGFLVPLLTGKSSGTGTVDPQSDDDGKPLEIIPLAEGNSKPFTIDPLPGITISAEENALDYDREITMTELPEETIDAAEAELATAVEQPYLAVGGWHLDAGLADDETLPGTFQMRFDLDEMGIQPEFYPGMTLFRRDDAGIWYEYAVGIQDHYMVADSYQNCDIIAVIAIGFVLSAPKIIDLVQGYVAGAYMNPYTGTFKVFVPNEEGGEDGKYYYEIMVDGWAIKKMLENVKAEMGDKVSKQCKDIAMKRVREERGIFENKPFSQWSKESKKLCMQYTQEEISKYVSESKITKQLDEAVGKNETEFREDFEAVGTIVKQCKRVYPYLKNNIGVNMPTYNVRIELSTTTELGVHGANVVPIIGNPYIVLNMNDIREGDAKSYQEMQLTLTHELFHVSQRLYVSKLRANVKFDELLAQMVEDDAAEYFYGLTTDQRKTSSNHRRFFAIPLDSKDVTYPEIRVKVEPRNTFFKILGLTFSGPVVWVEHLVDNILYIESDAAYYAAAPFVRYINEEYIVKQLSYHEIMTRYKSLWGSRSLTTILKKVFGLSEDELTKAYQKFGEEQIDKFYKEALGGNPAFAPFVPMVKEKKHVTLYNFSYTTRVRRFYGNKRTDKDKQFALLLKFDKNFADSAADLKMIPVDKTLGVDYHTSESMWFFEPMEIHNDYMYDNDIFKKAVYLMQKTPDLAILESDGGTGTKGWFTSSTTGYDAYIIYAPDEPKWSIEGTELQVELQPIEKTAERKDLVDSYAVTLRIGETQVFRQQVKFADLEKNPDEPWKCDLNELKLNGQKLTDTQRESLVMDIQECVTDTFETGPWLGPANPIELSGGMDIFGKWDIESKMNQLDQNYLDGILDAMPPGMKEAYEQALQSSNGQTTPGVMTVTKLDEEHIQADIQYDTPDAPLQSYDVKFDPKARTMTLTPKQQMLTDPLVLEISGTGSDLTFTCKMKYQSGIVDYDAELTGTKRKENAESNAE